MPTLKETVRTQTDPALEVLRALVRQPSVAATGEGLPEAAALVHRPASGSSGSATSRSAFRSPWGSMGSATSTWSSRRPPVIESGYTGQGSKTVPPRRARAKVDFRLVPDQDPEEIARLVDFEETIYLMARLIERFAGLP